MKRFISILAIWLVLIVIINSIMYVAIEQQSVPEISEPKVLDVDHELYAVIKRAHQLTRDKDNLAALALLEEHESAFELLPHPQQQLRYNFYQLKGHVHAALWQFIEAEVMWQQASEHATRSADKKRMRDLIQMSARAIDDMNQERHLKETYHASPRIGPASVLRGKVVLIYVFLADGTFSEWSLRQRTQALNTWHLAQDWLAQKAGNYASELTFSHRIFVINKHPTIKRIRVGDKSADFKNADDVALLAAKHLGHDTILDFINEIKKQEGADQVLLMYHIARDGRSFASRCMHRCNQFGEFVFLMETPKAKYWQSLQYTQAHESLHLFGADDLYNISKAKHYAVRDIMNYPASVLDASTIEDLTAFSIGLSDHPPVTPFKVKTYSTRR